MLLTEKAYVDKALKDIEAALKQNCWSAYELLHPLLLNKTYSHLIIKYPEFLSAYAKANHECVSLMANSLIAKDKELISKIDFQDLVSFEATDTPTALLAEGSALHCYRKHLDAITSFIKKDFNARTKDSLDAITLHFEHWRRVAYECVNHRDMKDYNMALCILKALSEIESSIPMHQLKIIFKGLTPEAMKISNELWVLTRKHKTKGYVNLNQEAKNNPFSIPYLRESFSSLQNSESRQFIDFYREAKPLHKRLKTISQRRFTYSNHPLPPLSEHTIQPLSVPDTHHRILLKAPFYLVKSDGSNSQAQNESSKFLQTSKVALREAKRALRSFLILDKELPHTEDHTKQAKHLLSVENVKITESIAALTNAILALDEAGLSIQENEKAFELFARREKEIKAHIDKSRSKKSNKEAYRKDRDELDRLEEALATLRNKIAEQQALSRTTSALLLKGDHTTTTTTNISPFQQILSQFNLNDSHLTTIQDYARKLFLPIPTASNPTVFDKIDPLTKVLSGLYLITMENADAFRKEPSTSINIALLKEFLNDLDMEQLVKLHDSLDVFVRNHPLISLPPQEITTHLQGLIANIPTVTLEPGETLTKKLLYSKLAANPAFIQHMRNFRYLGDKCGGAHPPGVHGGRYTFNYLLKEKNPLNGKTISTVKQQTILFKQDISRNGEIRHAKNICEVVAGALMNELVGDVSATVFFAKQPHWEKEDLLDETGENTYVGSIYFDNYNDLIDQLHDEQGLPILKDRPRFVSFFHRAIMAKTIDPNDKRKCIYDNFNEAIIASLIFGDYDVHSKNLGVCDDLDLVKIDHGGALKNLQKNIHMHKYRPPIIFENGRFKTQPTNHFVEYPRELKVNLDFANVLNKIANHDQISLIKRKHGAPVDERKTMAECIDDIINKMNEHYGLHPVIQFAERIGLSPNVIKKTKGNKESLINEIKFFLRRRIERRLDSAKTLSADIKLSLCITTLPTKVYEFDSFTIQSLPGEDKINGKYEGFFKLIEENPHYLLRGKYHFRAEGQRREIAETRFDTPYTRRLHKTVGLSVCENADRFTSQAEKTKDPSIIEYMLANETLYNHLKNNNKLVSLRCLYHHLLREKVLTTEVHNAETIKLLAEAIIGEILAEKHLKYRRLAVERWMSLMKKAKQEGKKNFELAIYSAFTSPPIIGLHNTIMKDHTEYLFTRGNELFAPAPPGITRDNIKSQNNSFMQYQKTVAQEIDSFLPKPDPALHRKMHAFITHEPITVREFLNVLLNNELWRDLCHFKQGIPTGIKEMRVLFDEATILDIHEKNADRTKINDAYYTMLHVVFIELQAIAKQQLEHSPLHFFPALYCHPARDTKTSRLYHTLVAIKSFDELLHTQIAYELHKQSLGYDQNFALQRQLTLSHGLATRL